MRGQGRLAGHSWSSDRPRGPARRRTGGSGSLSRLCSSSGLSSVSSSKASCPACTPTHHQAPPQLPSAPHPQCKASPSAPRPVTCEQAGAARDEAGAEADEAQQGDRGAEGGRELRVMERMAANLRDELEHKYTWFRLVRAAPDAAAAACSQVTGRGALGLALHCTWGAGVTREGLGGGWGCRRSRRPSTS